MSSKVEVNADELERQKFIEALEEITVGLKGRLFAGYIVSNDDGTEIVIRIEKGGYLM